ncbi:hypothetical protein XPA_009811 [Xanthoria parietina]
MFTYRTAQRAHFLALILATTVIKHTSVALARPAGNTGQVLPDQWAHVTCYPSSIDFPPPDPESCAEAIQHMPNLDTPLRSYSNRTRFLQLPHLFSSSDGKCVVRAGKGEEVVTGKRLRSLATELLNKCFIAQKGDGVAFLKSRDEFLIVTLERYNTSGITCTDPSPEPAPSGCEGALEMMGSDLDINKVRYMDSESVDPWDVHLPQTFLGPRPGENSTCRIELKVTGQEWLTPATMWQAAVAVNAVCVRRGQKGLMVGLGLSFLEIMVWKIRG